MARYVLPDQPTVESQDPHLHRPTVPHTTHSEHHESLRNTPDQSLKPRRERLVPSTKRS
jgi:hypothetical protein